MSKPLFDPVIHQLLQLRICGLLRHTSQVNFAVARDTLDVSAATLSKHVKNLVDAGYVSTGRTRSAARTDARRIMWLSLTKTGRVAFDAHVKALRSIVEPRQ